MSSTKPRVCVVGAGISGLRCAELLLENGFDVTVLEARNRIGGRICQSDKLGYTVDIGPNWIHTHDVGRHPILDLAIATNTPLHHWNNKQNIYTPSGDLLTPEKSNELSSLLWEVIEEAFSHSAKNRKNIPESQSLYDFFVAKAKENFPDGKEDGELLCQMSEMWGAYIGDPIQRQSLRFAWMEECCGGDEMIVETTYEAIFDKIAKLPLEKADIRLEERVTGVVTASREAPDGQVQIKTEKGETLCFDEVLMTTPLGWLKRNKNVFQPALPDRILAGIDAVSVGHLEKVYITFPEAFWIDPPSTITSSENLSQEQQMLSGDTFAGYTNWLSPNYSLATNPKRWPQEIWNLAAFSPPNRRPTILFYLYGDCSSYLTTLVHGKSTEEHHQLLDEFFRPYYSLLPNFSTENPACKAKAILSTEWQKDELSGFGSYCNFQVGVEDADGDVEAMRHGAPERRLWFAGEHTAPFEELGTAAGAYLSGEGVAYRILEVYGIESS